MSENTDEEWEKYFKQLVNNPPQGDGYALRPGDPGYVDSYPKEILEATMEAKLE